MSAATQAPVNIWPMLFPAAFFLLAGAALIAWPRGFLDRYAVLLGWMRRFPGRRLVEMEIGFLGTRLAEILTKLFGLFVMLAGLMIIFYAVSAVR